MVWAFPSEQKNNVIIPAKSKFLIVLIAWLALVDGASMISSYEDSVSSFGNHDQLEACLPSQRSDIATLNYQNSDFELWCRRLGRFPTRALTPLLGKRI